ncbi:MAG: ABC transporter permease [Candidatus Obscuribacterales bacterium]|nr:ABC transporter permease [Candidatus Obscuribacterales bacterium]
MPVELKNKSEDAAPAVASGYYETGSSNLSPLVNTRMADLWRFRDLAKLMVRRDLLGRYKGSLLGSFWPLINPAGHLLLYTFLFSVILKVKFGNTPGTSNFALCLMTGLIPWGAFAESIARSTTVILENPNLVKRVVFPLEILPLVSVISSFIGQGLALLILLVGSILVTGTVHSSLIYVPLISASLLVLTCGISWFLSSFGVFVRDTRHFMSLALSAWMYATPIVYPETALPENFRWLSYVNPMSGIVNDYRRVLLEGLAPDWTRFGIYTAFGVLAWFAGYYFFSKTKKTFIDIM